MNKLGHIDFQLVESLSLIILRERSKDIRIIFFLSLAYLKKDDWERFSDVFEGLTYLAESHYDSIFPDRERAKQMAFGWLSEDRFNEVLKNRKPQEDNIGHILRLDNSLGKLKEVLEQKFPIDSPFPHNFYTIVKNWIRTITDVQKTKAEEVNKAAIEDSAKESKPSVQSGSEHNDIIELDNGGAQKNVKIVALYLIDKQPQKPLGYRLLRNIRWDQLENAPTAVEGRTLIEGPSPQLRKHFQYLLLQKDWNAILKKSEVTFASGYNHLWIDIQRYVVSACNGLGECYGAIASAVLQDTLYLIRRVPDLINMRFQDCSFFCDEQTRAWIAINNSSSVDHHLTQHYSGHSRSFKTESEKIDESIEGDIEQVLSGMNRAIRSSTDEREKFKKTIDLGSFLVKIDQSDLAVPVLESLDRQISEYHLASWDPGLSVEAWVALAEAYRTARISKPQQAEIMDKISKADPLKAYLLIKQDRGGKDGRFISK